MIQQLTTQEHLAKALVISIGTQTESKEVNQFYHKQIMKAVNYLQLSHTKKAQVKSFIELIEEITISMPEDTINKAKINLVIESMIEHLGEND